MKIDDLLQPDPFGSKVITITANNLNQTQINKFIMRMRELVQQNQPGTDFFLYLQSDILSDNGRGGGDRETPTTTKKPTTKAPWGPDATGPSVIDAGDYSTSTKSPFRWRARRFAFLRDQPLEDEEEADDQPPLFSVRILLEFINDLKVFERHVELNQLTSEYDALWVLMVQVAAVVVCYHSSLFACKVNSVNCLRQSRYCPRS
jgi:hypothetical protein